IISEANGWTEGIKACQLVASLRGEAAEVLQTLSETELLNLNSLYNSLDLRFGQKYSKDYAHLQMKTRHQKPEESLQEYVFEIQSLTTLAFSDFSENVRERISLEYFSRTDGRMKKSIGLTEGDEPSRAGGVVNQAISEVTAPEIIRKIVTPSAGDAVKQGT
ncbi:uncharacterized protein TNCV_1700151, partial [Trichonephila clavipes]